MVSRRRQLYHRRSFGHCLVSLALAICTANVVWLPYVQQDTTTAAETTNGPVTETLSTFTTKNNNELSVSETDSIQRATRLLYSNSKSLEHWLAKPPPTVYVYDSLDEEFSVESVSQCIDRRYNSDKSNGHHRATCGWTPQVCDEDSMSSNRVYNIFRDNFNSDVFVIAKFQQYKHQTRDPNKADFFFVPYPHKSHCFCVNDDRKKIYKCSYDFAYIRENILDRLSFYNETTKDRHLFVLGSDFQMANPPFRREVPFHLTTGPADGCRPNRHSRGKPHDANCGSLTIPFVSTDLDHQPKQLKERMSSLMNVTRRYSVAAVMGTPPQLVIRREFMDKKDQLIGESVGGLPVAIDDLGEKNRFLPSRRNVMNIYGNSTFCLILPGDDCGQKRFFDAIFQGCIPVLLSYESDEAPFYPSFFKPRACSIRRSYPFMKGTFHGDSTAGIDVRDLVVQVDGTCGLNCLKEELEGALRNRRRIQQILESIQQVASLFSYGLEPSDFPDAFDALLVLIRHYLADL